MTITEALAEIKTINARVVKRLEAIGPYVLRDSRIRDPLEKDGGSASFIASELQAARDLTTRAIALRTSIQKANLAQSLSVNGESRTVAEWLTWRREHSATQKSFTDNMLRSIGNARDKFRKEGGVTALQNKPSGVQEGELVVNVDEKWLLGESDRLEKVLGDLDGQLSLFNARTEVAV
jgi:hypothetical protein